MAFVVLTVVIALAIAMRVTRPVLLDQHEGPALDESTLPDARIDLNQAGAAELTLLPGVGPETARRIVDDRHENGPFASLADLARVRGVGQVTIDRIAAYVVVEDPADPAD